MIRVISQGQVIGRDRARARTTGGHGLERNLDNGPVINVHIVTVRMITNVLHVVKKRKVFWVIYSAVCSAVKMLIPQLHPQLLSLKYQSGCVLNVPITTTHPLLYVSNVPTISHGRSQ